MKYFSDVELISIILAKKKEFPKPERYLLATAICCFEQVIRDIEASDGKTIAFDGNDNLKTVIE